MNSDDLRSTAGRWLAAEPDDDIRTELQALIDGDADELAARFADRLQFGTAGLRAAVGAGPLRMNRLVVRQAAAGLAQYLLDTDPLARERGVVVGYDARRKSDVFAADTARVMAAVGIPARLFDQQVPTPVLAWSITHLGCAAGVVVTASHNPPADNGYKVYLGDGAQIVPPHDVGISACIGRVDATSVPLAPDDDPLISTVGDELVDAYIASVPAVRRRPDVAGVPVAYTAMHGVGGETVLRAFEAAGLPAPAVVAEQFEPDGSFPTVSFPNPEEPGAMDLLMSVAQSSGAHAALANDPDADRLGVAIPQADGSWRRLGGDEIGWLFADYLLGSDTGADRLVVTTLVSSSLLGKMAAAHGVHAAETFTGFKWIARAVHEHPDLRFVMGYEQALGYLVAAAPLDKDGITAAVLFAEMAAVAAAEGRTMQDWLDDLASRFGRHVLADAAVRMQPADAAAKVAALRAAPPAAIGGRAVVATDEYPEADLVRFELEGGVRVQIRPSGTEPKVKLYGEAVDEDPKPFVDALAALLA
ncbi:MAG: phospho-sugar mutase [Ilumatobacter sp.]|uniref:phospho-sugar mutase n=1 Tax=Ilumatobacter sp. TaxID=1967498 RepID=UPI0026038B70|nr:phospho-sugar mutase [Ilumatobacter sp.]MDJ0767722.1 phospho-sugar mutase [Ilumatobacter sp.]